MLAVASLAGLMMFAWPLILDPDQDAARVDPPFFFLILLPLIVGVVIAELTEGGMDSKALAMLGVLTAINAALRTLGAGTAGVELVFFLLILAGRVFGAGFGFVLGCTSLFASALLTSGVGPWLPFQMLASAWIGMGAGLLPRRVTGKAEIAMLVVFGVFCAYFFGMLDESVVMAVHPRYRGRRSYRIALVRAGCAVAGEPAPFRHLHAAVIDGRVGHRAGDHQLGRDRRARPGDPGHVAACRAQGLVRGGARRIRTLLLWSP